jgi:hypothetical protein
MSRRCVEILLRETTYESHDQLLPHLDALRRKTSNAGGSLRLEALDNDRDIFYGKATSKGGKQSKRPLGRILRVARALAFARRPTSGAA